MSTHYEGDRPPRREDVSGWAIGGMMFAATMLGMVGLFQILVGFVALVDDEFFVVTRNYTFDVDVTVWGLAHLALGAIALAVSFGLLSQSKWAGVTALVIAVLSAVANFFFIPYYPIWSLVLIGINVWIIWSVTRPGALSS